MYAGSAILTGAGWGAWMVTIGQLEAVDRFLAGDKHLYGEPPEFGPAHVSRKGVLSEAVWPIADSEGIISTGQIRIMPRIGSCFTISVIFAGQCITRLDFVAMTDCESNPPWAYSMGLPATVCGPHLHSWVNNRQEILRIQSATWTMPLRVPLPVQIRKFSQALPWLAAHLKLMLTAEQRLFELPTDLV